MNESVLIVGAGHQGIAMAAHLALNGVDVNLWNRTYAHVQAVMEEGGILVNGVVSGRAHVKKISTNLEEVLARLIMVTVPASAHRDIAVRLAPYVNAGHIIILNPGRTFGALEFAKTLRESGCRSMPIIAETQTIIYTCRRDAEAAVSIYAFKRDVYLAALRQEDTKKALAAMPECLRDYFQPAQSWIQTQYPAESPRYF